MDLKQAQDLILQVVESPDAPASEAITSRQLGEAIATVLVRNQLLAPPPSDA